MFVEGVTDVAYDDVDHRDPDFDVIQGTLLLRCYLHYATLQLSSVQVARQSVEEVTDVPYQCLFKLLSSTVYTLPDSPAY